MIVKTLSFVSVACIAAAAVLFFASGDDNTPAIVILILAAFGITTLLGIRAGFHKARGVVNDTRTFLSGDIQQARLVSVGDPKGFLTPEATVVLELEGEDGTVHPFERDVPIPFPMAWSYRFGKRFNMPFLQTDLSDLMAFELKREGMDVSVGRGDATT